MIMPDGINPNKSLLYVAGLLLNEIDDSWKEPLDIIMIFQTEFSLRLLLLAFDWLFIADALCIKREGGLVYVSKKTGNKET